MLHVHILYLVKKDNSLAYTDCYFGSSVVKIITSMGLLEVFFGSSLLSLSFFFLNKMK
jgi:hypothetical protein